MPFELLSLECQVHKGTGWCWDEWSDCLCLSKVRPGSFCKKNPTNIDPKLQAGSIQVVLSLEARTTMFSLPYRSVAKFPRKKKKSTVFLSHLWMKLYNAKKKLLFCRYRAQDEIHTYLKLCNSKKLLLRNFFAMEILGAEMAAWRTLATATPPLVCCNAHSQKHAQPSTEVLICCSPSFPWLPLSFMSGFD